MPPLIASIVYALGIMGLFALQRERGAPSPKALWLPVIWLSLAGSRMVSQWLNVSPLNPAADQLIEGSPLDRVVLTGLLVLGIVVLLGRRHKLALLAQQNVALLLFVAYCSVSVLWSDYPATAFKHWIKFVGDLVMVMVVLTDVDPEKAVKRLLSAVGFLLLPISILFIKYYPEMGRAYDHWTGTAVYIGVTTDKNMLGMICLVLGLGCVWQLAEAWQDDKGMLRTRRLIAQGTLLLMVIWLLHQAHSMTSGSCFVLGSAIILLTSFSRLAGRPAAVRLAVIVSVAIALSALFLNVGDGVVQTMGRDSTLTGRTELWKHLLKMNEDSLLGTGFGSFWLGKRLEELWALYWWRPSESHNGYLEIFLNLGWVGIALLVSVIVAGYRHVVSCFRRCEPARSLRLAFFVVAIIYNLTEAAFKMMNPVWMAFLLAITAMPAMPVTDIASTDIPSHQGQHCESEAAISEIASFA